MSAAASHESGNPRSTCPVCGETYWDRKPVLDTGVSIDEDARPSCVAMSDDGDGDMLVVYLHEH